MGQANGGMGIRGRGNLRCFCVQELRPCLFTCISVDVHWTVKGGARGQGGLLCACMGGCRFGFILVIWAWMAGVGTHSKQRRMQPRSGRICDFRRPVGKSSNLPSPNTHFLLAWPALPLLSCCVQEEVALPAFSSMAEVDDAAAITNRSLYRALAA